MPGGYKCKQNKTRHRLWTYKYKEAGINLKILNKELRLVLDNLINSFLKLSLFF